MNQPNWSETIILADADYIDGVAFDLIVNFERMIGRAIPQADLCQWLDCIALDGGLQPRENAIQAIFIHNKGKQDFDNFRPASFSSEINGKAFKDNMGEFCMMTYAVEEIVSKEDFFVQSLEMLLESKSVKRVLVIGDMLTSGNRIKRTCQNAKGKNITLFTMEPITGVGFNQEILGYSLMSALGITADELCD